VDTSTTYLGLKLAHPFIAGASPMGYHLDTIKRLEDAGCAAIVLHSLFEEQISPPESLEPEATLEQRFAHTVADFPGQDDYHHDPDAYVEHVRAVKAAVGIPVIASLNGRSGRSWLKFAQVIEQAGADALEFNHYEVAGDLRISAAAIEVNLADAVHNLTRLLKIPVAIKLTPFFTTFGHLASTLDKAGASGLVLFNRFYQSDINTTTMKLAPQAELSGSNELLLRLHWLALLYGRVRPSLAISGGVATPDDGIKALLAGADAVQLVSALLRHGPDHLGVMRRALERWLEWHRMDSLAEMRGRASLQGSRNPEAFERAHYIRTLQSWTR
jgi:dihydroorotate dehydrogenase (fumarate)